MKQYAKALTAILAVLATSIAAGTLEVPLWVGVLIESVIAGVAVWAVPNSDGG